MLPLAVTMGDPAGIGPDITLMSWLEHQRTRNSAPLPAFFLIADLKTLSERAKQLQINVPIEAIDTAEQAPDVFAKALPVLSLDLDHPVEIGKPSLNHAHGVIESIRLAVDFVAREKAGAVVTNPIAKATLYAKDFKYPGHTEFLGELAHKLWPEEHYTPVMMLAEDQGLRVVPVTIHIPLRDVADAITPKRLATVITATHNALKRDFGIKEPRIAVTGLNPHAGESGTLGREETDIIIPALDALRQSGLKITGPHPADTLFHAAARETYDAAVAMYHDQALVPLKALAFDRGVNITLGLPFVRTSPDHGTAFDIAGTGKAKPDSLIASLRTASTMVSSRRAQQS